MKRDIRKAVEEIKSAGWRISYTKIQVFFECDDDKFTHHHCTTGCKCTTGGKMSKNKMYSRETLYVRYKMYARKNGHLLRNVHVYVFKMDVRYESNA